MGRELTQDPASRGLTEEDIVHIPGLASRWVRLANGAKAHYTTSGETGPAIILLHGGINGSSGTAGWRFMAPFLGANGFRVYCPDQPGFGHADTREEYWPKRGSQELRRVHQRLRRRPLPRQVPPQRQLDGLHPHGALRHQPPGARDQLRPHRRRRWRPRRPEQAGRRARNSKFSANPGYQRPPFDYDKAEESQRVLMEGIIYEAKAIWPELITMRAKAALRQRDSFESRVASTRGTCEGPELPAVGLHQGPPRQADDPGDLHVRHARRPHPG